MNAQRQNVFVGTSANRPEPTGRFEAGETVEFAVSFENPLAPGRYAVSTLISLEDQAIVDRWEAIFTFVVTGARATGGIVDVPHDTTIVRAGSGSMARGAT